MMAASIPPAIAPRVAQLVKLLGSDVDGEALGAARALRRTLAAHGADFHTLADAIERPTVSPSPERQGGGVLLDHARRLRVAEALRRGLDGDRLSDWEATFATSILARVEAGRGRLTGKQGDALGRLLHRLGEGATWV